ncbi:MAG: HAD-IIIA family hydrolase [Chloroflexota bacterium]
MTAKLRIGQITDLHARHVIHGSSAAVNRRSRDVLGLLPLAIDQLKSHDVDFLVLTGDLVDVPDFILDPNDYYHMDIETWLPLVRADYQAIKDILDESGLPYMVLPGNHDYERVMWQVFDQSTNVVDVAQGYRVVRFCDREWEGHVPRRFDRERKLWMEMLADVQSPPQVHLQHYVITPQIDHHYPHNYFEADHILEKTSVSGNVRLSLSGHYHSGSELLRINESYFATGRAFCESPHPFRLYELSEHDVRMQEFTILDEPNIYCGRNVVFLDRDGVINNRASYTTGPEDFELIPGAAQAILKLRQAGYAVVINTNQSCIGLGYVSQSTVVMTHERMCQLLVEETGDEDAQPDLILFSVGAGEYAVHHSLADTSVTKPSPALLKQAEELLNLNPQGAWMVGDRATDLQAALAYGATPILVRTGNGAGTEQTLGELGFDGVVVCDDLVGAVKHILLESS